MARFRTKKTKAHSCEQAPTFLYAAINYDVCYWCNTRLAVLVVPSVYRVTTILSPSNGSVEAIPATL
jgi:hypothetical protein